VSRSVLLLLRALILRIQAIQQNALALLWLDSALLVPV